MSHDGLKLFGAGFADEPVVRAYACEICSAALPDRLAWLRGGGLCDGCVATRLAAEQLEQLAAAQRTIPALFRDVRFGEVAIARVVRGDTTEAMRACSAAYKQVQAVTEWQTLVLHGPRRGGKTTLAVAKLYQAIDAASDGDQRARKLVRSARFVAAWDLGEARFRHALGDGEAPLVEAAMGASLLILDDLGKEARRGRDVLSQVLQERWASGRKTIVTTELDGRGVAGLYTTDACSGEYLQGRLFEQPAVAIRVGGT